jgi:hypothetical protein
MRLIQSIVLFLNVVEKVEGKKSEGQGENGRAERKGSRIQNFLNKVQIST